jgi:hypothetical protein
MINAPIRINIDEEKGERIHSVATLNIPCFAGKIIRILSIQREEGLEVISYIAYESKEGTKKSTILKRGFLESQKDLGDYYSTLKREFEGLWGEPVDMSVVTFDGIDLSQQLNELVNMEIFEVKPIRKS